MFKNLYSTVFGAGGINSTKELLERYFSLHPTCAELNMRAILDDLGSDLSENKKLLNIKLLTDWLEQRTQDTNYTLPLPATHVPAMRQYYQPTKAAYKVEKVNLSGFRLSINSLTTLLNFFKNNKTIKELNLSKTSLNDEGIALIIEMLKVNKTLQKINLELNPFTTKYLTDYLVELKPINSKVHISYVAAVDDQTFINNFNNAFPHALNNSNVAHYELAFNPNSPIINRNAAHDHREIAINTTINNIFTLIAESDSRIVEMRQSNTAKELLIIWGPTAAGKTTLALMLSKLMQTKRVILEIFKSEDLGDFKIRDIYTSTDERSKIGSHYYSETKFPNKFEAEGDITIFDCPGTLDTEGIEHEIANMFFISKIFDTKKPCKFLINVPCSSITDTRQAGLIATLKHFIKIFETKDSEESYQNIVKLKDSIGLVVTHADANISKDNIEKVFAGVLRDNLRLDPRVKYILENLKDKIYVFHKPTQEGIINEPELKISDLSGLIAVSDLKGCLALSDQDANTPQKLLDQVNANIEKINKVIKAYFSNNFVKLPTLDVTKPLNANIFNENYQDIAVCLPSSTWHHSKLQNLETRSSFLALEEIAEIYTIFGKHEDNLENNLKVLIDTLAVIEKFSNDNDFKIRIKDYAHILQQQIGYMTFLEKLCEKNPHNPLQKTLEESAYYIEELLNPAIKCIKLKTGQVMEYYQEALFWLNKCSTPKDVQNTKSDAHYYIGLIYEDERNYKEAMKNYVAAIEANPKLPQTYEHIGDILCELNKYDEAIKYYKVANKTLKIITCLDELKATGGFKNYIKVGDFYAETGIVDQAILYYKIADSFATSDPQHIHAREQILACQRKHVAMINKAGQQLHTSEFNDYSHVSKGSLGEDLKLIMSYDQNEVNIIGNEN